MIYVHLCIKYMHTEGTFGMKYKLQGTVYMYLYKKI